ncbi:hypothetical protein OAO18_06420 [Francisellaceae bacterium]|nr:hypothetical protein [Francisellaceae bacterium]
MFRKIALVTTLTVLLVFSAMANQNKQINLKSTAINISTESGSQARPEIAIAYSGDVHKIYDHPNIYWEATETGSIKGNKENNVHNATIDQFLKLNGEEASFIILIDDGSGSGYIPAMINDDSAKYNKTILTEPFSLKKGQIRNCTVSLKKFKYGPDLFWTATCDK